MRPLVDQGERRRRDGGRGEHRRARHRRGQGPLPRRFPPPRRQSRSPWQSRPQCRCWYLQQRLFAGLDSPAGAHFCPLGGVGALGGAGSLVSAGLGFGTTSRLSTSQRRSLPFTSETRTVAVMNRSSPLPPRWPCMNSSIVALSRAADSTVLSVTHDSLI